MSLDRDFYFYQLCVSSLSEFKIFSYKFFFRRNFMVSFVLYVLIEKVDIFTYYSSASVSNGYFRERLRSQTIVLLRSS